MTRRAEFSLASRPVLSHAADAVAADGVVFVAGVLPVDAGGALVGKGDAAEQARHVLADLGEILAEAGCATADLVSVNVYLTAIEDRAAVEEPFDRAFGPVRPAGTLVSVSALAVPGALIEIDAVAVRP